MQTSDLVSKHIIMFVAKKINVVYVREELRRGMSRATQHAAVEMLQWKTLTMRDQSWSMRSQSSM